MQFHSRPVEEHGEVPLADDGRLEALLDHWSALERPAEIPEGASACYVVSVGDWRDEVHRDAQLGEICGLVEANGDLVVGFETLRLRRPNARTYVGPGAITLIVQRARACGADMLVVDAELTPSQTRNLEDATGFAICDREAVILGVFLKRARTRKARIQVEIAHLEYLRPRIRGIGLDMDQQAGGIMQGKGAGETASELLARRLDGRLAKLRKAFARLERSGSVQRKGRDGCARIALVGYTNAGKTSLMNALTGAELSARDRPFETLDTTSRALTRRGGDVLLNNTVGFIRHLPQRLLASFESTLAEVKDATLLAIVVDLSDPEWELHIATTDAVLERLGVADTPRFYVFNKFDRVDQVSGASIGAAIGDAPSCFVSAHEPESVDDLRRRLLAATGNERPTTWVFVPYGATHVIRQAYGTCTVLHVDASDKGVQLQVRGPVAAVERLRKAAAEVRA